ncbi:OmpH family outer membrane protein [Roseomonas sp. NAR14]|uniref:OmpH family outer membrane protein n=1 Tax=Roseomonas acroporae TaxID=2937791 RepID=A0A9X1YDQ2_9PROT|nr:OmpH family outer membrane protein [Roseomonas acroporae]MCK8787145.1 OmpH family outer membrane protein [Roseomonas acroporae]
MRPSTAPSGARLRAALLGAAALPLLLAVPARAQQQEWFIPNQGGGQGRPAQQAQQPQRPAQQAQPQRPAQQAQPQRQAPPALPPGQQPPAAVVGIVDVPEVQRVSTAFNQVREEIERRRQKLNEDLQREQQNWREQQQQLANTRATLSPEQLRQRERDLQDRITDAQRIFRDRSRGIEQAAQQALVEIEQGLAVVIRQVAASRNVNLVLPRPLVIYNDPQFDLTEEVANQFNRALRTVTLPAESAAPAAQAAGQGGQAAAPAQPARPAQPAQQGNRR